jgi:hypothetical protein
MEAIETKVDKKDPQYLENYGRMEAMVARLNEELRIAREVRSEKALGRLAEQNKLSVRKRLELLLDKNTPVLEIAPLAAYDMYDKGVHGAGSPPVPDDRHGKPPAPDQPGRFRRGVSAFAVRGVSGFG